MARVQYRHLRPRPATVMWLDRVENRVPGRVAFVVHRSRRSARNSSRASLEQLQEWARRRADRLDENRPASEFPTQTSAPDADDASTADDHDERPVPTSDWTKGELYELARELEIDGRSKLDKQALLEAVRERLGHEPEEVAA